MPDPFTYLAPPLQWRCLPNDYMARPQSISFTDAPDHIASAGTMVGQQHCVVRHEDDCAITKAVNKALASQRARHAAIADAEAQHFTGCEEMQAQRACAAIAEAIRRA